MPAPLDVCLSRLAEDDLNDLWEWIAADNRSAADKLISDIIQSFAQIVRFPDSGSCRPEWTSRPLRFIVVRKIILVIYHPSRRPVEIARILHTSRDVKAVLEENG